MPKAKWKPKAISDEAKAWLAKPINQRLFCDEPQAELEQFLDGDDILLGAVAFDLGQISFRYSVLAEAKVLDRPEESLEHLIQSQQYKLRQYQMFIRVNALDHRSEKQGRVAFNEAGLFLARLIALGYFAEVETLSSRMLLALRENLYYGIETTKAAPFIFDLYAKSRGEFISFEGFDVERVEIYQKMVELLPSASLGEVLSSVTKACDYHVERGQYSDDEVDYEYDSDLDRIFPAEILAFLRLRQKMGLTAPEIRHLVLNNPLAKLHEPKPFPDDPFLDRVIQAADVLLREQEGQ